VKTKNYQRVYKTIVTSLLIAATASSLTSCLHTTQPSKAVIASSKINTFIDLSTKPKLPVQIALKLATTFTVEIKSNVAGVLYIEGIDTSKTHIVSGGRGSIAMTLGESNHLNFIFKPDNGVDSLVAVVKTISIY